MGKITFLSKWDLLKNKWKLSSIDEIGKSFGIVDYDYIQNRKDKEYDVIIFCTGCRIENVSKDNISVKDSKNGIKRSLDFFQNSDKNVRVKLLLNDNDAPLINQGMFFASLVDRLSSDSEINSINIVGHSKAAIMTFDMMKYLKKPVSLEKTNLFTLSAPFNGTLMASPKIVFPLIEDIIKTKIPNSFIADKTFDEIIKMYKNISSYSHMDFDIAMKGGIPDDLFHLYDPTLIENIFSKENIEAINLINCYKNICTCIDESTFKKCIKSLDFTGMGLCILDSLLFEEVSDGLVALSAQRMIENYTDDINFESILLSSAHHGSLNSPYAANDIFRIVDDTLSEQQEIRNFQKRLK